MRERVFDQDVVAFELSAYPLGDGRAPAELFGEREFAVFRWSAGPGALPGRFRFFWQVGKFRHAQGIPLWMINEPDSPKKKCTHNNKKLYGGRQIWLYLSEASMRWIEQKFPRRSWGRSKYIDLLIAEQIRIESAELLDQDLVREVGDPKYRTRSHVLAENKAFKPKPKRVRQHNLRIDP